MKSRPTTPPVLSFDYAESVLSKLYGNLSSNFPKQLYYSDNNEDEIIRVLQLVLEEDTEDLKLGILFRFGSHTTPIIIEKRHRENDEGEIISEDVYLINQDSIALNSDGGEAMRLFFKEVAAQFESYPPRGKIERSLSVYSLNIEDMPNITLQYQRQHDETSCFIFSLLDCQLQLKENLTDFFIDNSQPVNPFKNLYNIDKLPPQMMLYCQSVHGRQSSSGDWDHKGLKQYTEDNPGFAGIPICFTPTSLAMNSNHFDLLFKQMGMAKSPVSILKEYSSESNEDQSQTEEWITTLRQYYLYLAKTKNGKGNFYIDFVSRNLWDLMGDDIVPAKNDCFSITKIDANVIFDLGAKIFDTEDEVQKNAEFSDDEKEDSSETETEKDDASANKKELRIIIATYLVVLVKLELEKKQERSLLGLSQANPARFFRPVLLEDDDEQKKELNLDKPRDFSA